MAARPPCHINSTALVSERAVLTGSHPITIGEHAVIHPFAQLRSENGAVTIGPFCTVEENAVVAGESGEGVVLERGVSVASGAVVLGSRLGEGAEIGVKARVGRGSVVGLFASVGAGEVVGDGEVVEDFGVVFAGGKWRVDGLLKGSAGMRELRVRGQEGTVRTLGGLVTDGGAKWRG